MTGPAVARVLIVGGGITGLTASVALRQKGIDVILIERSSKEGADGSREFAPVGHGLTIQGNALKAFDQVGIFDQLKEKGYPFNHLRMRLAHNGDVIAEMPTPPMGGPRLPGTMGALRSDVAHLLAQAARESGVDIRLGLTVQDHTDHGDRVEVSLSDGTTETVDLLIAADGINSTMRKRFGFTQTAQPVGMGIWRVVADRPAEMDCSEVYYGGPKYKAGYTPISEDKCYAFLIEENLDRSFVGEKPNGAVMKEHGAGYNGLWGQVRDSIADDAVVNYQWIEAVVVDEPWHRGRTLIIGDAAHACPPLIAQGAAMCSEDAVVLADELAGTDDLDAALQSFWERRFPRVKMVLDNSLQLAAWEIKPDTPGADPGRIMGQTLAALCEPA